MSKLALRLVLAVLGVALPLTVAAGTAVPTPPPAGLVAQAAEAEPTITIGSLVITSPWARATPRGAQVGGGYLKITNNGTTPDRLVGGSLAAAGMVQVHEMSMSGGVMQMRHLEQGLEIKPGETVELKPGGFHLMFMTLHEPLREGQTIKGTLVFEKAGTVEVTFSVLGMGAQGPMGTHSHMQQ